MLKNQKNRMIPLTTKNKVIYFIGEQDHKIYKGECQNKFIATLVTTSPTIISPITSLSGVLLQNSTRTSILINLLITIAILVISVLAGVLANFLSSKIKYNYSLTAVNLKLKYSLLKRAQFSYRVIVILIIIWLIVTLFTGYLFIESSNLQLLITYAVVVFAIPVLISGFNIIKDRNCIAKVVLKELYFGGKEFR